MHLNYVYYEFFWIHGCWCFIIWKLHEACYHIPSTSFEKEQTFVCWLSCWIYWFHRILCIDDHTFCDCWRFHHPLGRAIWQQCETFRWSTWVTQYHSTCSRSNTHWRSHNWSDPHSIYPSIHGNHGITMTKTMLLLSDHLWVECLSTWRNRSFCGKQSRT